MALQGQQRIYSRNTVQQSVVSTWVIFNYITQPYRLVRMKGASWSLNWPSVASMLSHMQPKYTLQVPL